MATKKESVVVEAKVKKPSPKRVKTAVKEADKAIIMGGAPSSEEVPTIVNRVSDKGEINLSQMTPKEKKYYMEIASSLDENDMSTVSTYGCDLQKAIGSHSNSLLSQQFNSRGNDAYIQLLTDLRKQLKEVDIDELKSPTALTSIIRKIPLLRNLVSSIEEIHAKYDTIDKNIEEITSKLEAFRQIAIRDNNALQKQFEDNVDYIDQLEDLIVAAKMKSNDLAAAIEEMKANPQQYKTYAIGDVEEYKANLDKRIYDLTVVRFSYQQSLAQIRIIQRTNMMDANNMEAQISLTVPLWRNQLSLAVALHNQKKSVEAKNKIYETTNEMIRKNAEMMQEQAVEVARQNQRGVVDIKTLEEMTEKLISTVDGVKKAQEEGAAQRMAAEARLVELEKKTSQALIGVQETAHRVVAKELQASRDAKKRIGTASY